MIIEVLLEKYSGGESLRTSSVRGFATQLPIVGNCFTMFGDPYDPKADFRLVKTSNIVAVDTATMNDQGQECYLVHTLNSVYKVTVLHQLAMEHK